MYINNAITSDDLIIEGASKINFCITTFQATKDSSIVCSQFVSDKNIRSFISNTKNN